MVSLPFLPPQKATIPRPTSMRRETTGYRLVVGRAEGKDCLQEQPTPFLHANEMKTACVSLILQPPDAPLALVSRAWQEDSGYPAATGSPSYLNGLAKERFIRSPAFLKIQTRKRFSRMLFFRTKTQFAKFRGNPLCQATFNRTLFIRTKTQSANFFRAIPFFRLHSTERYLLGQKHNLHFFLRVIPFFKLHSTERYLLGQKHNLHNFGVIQMGLHIA